MTPVISVRNVTFSYEGFTALSDVSLDIGAGEFVAIVGQSGSGKSTLLRLLGLMAVPSSGEIWIGERRVDELGDEALSEVRNRMLGFVFQDAHLLPALSVEENILLPCLYDGRNGLPRHRATATELGIGDLFERKPNALSGGQQQRVAIARALVNRPMIILADEPTGALDTVTSREVLTALSDTVAQGGTLVVVTHDPEVASRAHRIIEIRDGRVLSDHRRSAERVPVPCDVPAGEPQRALGRVRAGWRQVRHAFSMATRMLATHRLRSLVTLAGFVLGIFLTVSVLTAGALLRRLMDEHFTAMGFRDLVGAWTESAEPPPEFSTAAATLDLHAGPVARPRLFARWLVDRLATEWNSEAGTQALVVPSEAVGSLFPEVECGSLQTLSLHGNPTASLGGVVLGKQLAQRLAPPASDGERHRSLCGLRILVGDRIFARIDAVVAPSTRTPQLFVDDLAAGILLRPSQARTLGLPNHPNLMVLSPRRNPVPEDFPAVAAAALSAAPPWVQAFPLASNERELATIRRTFAATAVFVSVVSVLCLLIAGVGIMNIMLATISERYREIAVRRAFGATKRAVRNQFLAETIIFCLLGGALGMGLALLVSQLALSVCAVLFPRHVTILAAWDPVALGVGTALCIAAGFVFGMLPARQASAIDIYTALNRE